MSSLDAFEDDGPPSAGSTPSSRDSPEAVGHQVYVSGAMSGLEPNQEAALRREVFEPIVAACQDLGLAVYAPQTSGTKPDSPWPDRDIWNIDRSRVQQARLVVAYVGLPSFGVGAEIEMAHQAGLPIVLVREQQATGEPLSRLIKGYLTSSKVEEFPRGHIDATKDVIKAAVAPHLADIMHHGLILAASKQGLSTDDLTPFFHSIEAFREDPLRAGSIANQKGTKAPVSEGDWATTLKRELPARK